jgi:hypothetical protein
MSTTILEGYVPLAQFAREEVKRHPRTVIRWTEQPDGLPYTQVGNQKFLHIDTSREWLFRRMRRPNARRAPEAA